MRPLIFLVVFFMLSSPSPSSGSAFPIAKPGCDDHCGNVSIPFPFGTREGCYLDERFLIKCQDSSRTAVPPLPTLGSTEINISDILLLEGQLRILNFIGRACYENNQLSKFNSPSILAGPAMTFSSSANVFTTIGCDSNSFVQGKLSNGTTDSTPYTSGCMSICDNKADVEDGSCSGRGCCQTSIPRGAWEINVTMGSYYNHSHVSSFNNCTFAFVVEAKAFLFFADNLTNLDTVISLPVVVDWVIAYETCEVAQQNSSAYACRENSTCYVENGSLGYRCKCLDGYEGNPYLPNGCQVICVYMSLPEDPSTPQDSCPNTDECANHSDNCAINSVCVNTWGNYTCTCVQGYHGDGRSRDGCIADQKPNKKNYWPIFTGVFSCLGSLLLIATIFTLYKLVKRKRDRMIKDKCFKRNGGLLLQQQLSADEGIVEKTRIFTSSELDKATDGFNPNLILGQGGQGTVYKGMLTDGRLVAIKKSKRVDESQLEQFINEVVILSQVNHRNVVKLLGCCLETEVPVLVYELIPNGTLFSLIHNKNDGDNDQFPFTWKLRLRIATEVAGALAYLHSATLIPIYHRDIKSSNILLDEKYIAKVSDFGTSRSIAIDKTHITTNVKGTFVYLDPEYFQSSQFTEKSDVYSFGVVLVELLTRKKPISSSKIEEDSHLSLATRFLISMDKNGLHNILDPQVLDEGNRDEVVTMAKLAQRCLSLNGKNRPTMKEVAIELETIKLSAVRTTVAENFHSRRLFNGEENELVMFTDGNPSWTTETGSVGIELTDAYPLLHDTI